MKRKTREELLLARRIYLKEWLARPGNKDKAKASAKRSRAKPDVAARIQAYQRSPESVARHKRYYQKVKLGKHLKARYGLDVITRNEMWRIQGGCAICLDQTAKPQVDHDHKTGAVRQLLCGRCNAGIGMFLERPDLLERAASYVNMWKTFLSVEVAA